MLQKSFQKVTKRYEFNWKHNNITTTENLLRSNAKKQDFLLQWGKDIDHGNGKLTIKKEELERLFSRTSIFHKAS